MCVTEEGERGREGGGGEDAGSCIPPATSSVHDVCDTSQIRSGPDSLLGFQPLTPQLGPTKALASVQLGTLCS